MTAETKEAALTRLRGASAWQAERHHRKLFYNFEHGAFGQFVLLAANGAVRAEVPVDVYVRVDPAGHHGESGEVIRDRAGGR